MFPANGTYACYLSTQEATPPKPNEEHQIDAIGRLWCSNAYEMMHVPYLLADYPIDIIGISMWEPIDEDHPIYRESGLDVGPEHGELRLCHVYANDLAEALEIYERELIAGLAVASQVEQISLESIENSNLIQTLDLSLCSIQIEFFPEMTVSALYVINDLRDDNESNFESGGDFEAEDGLESSSIFDSRIGEWARENRDNILISLLTGAAVDAAMTVLDHGEYGGKSRFYGYEDVEALDELFHPLSGSDVPHRDHR